MKEFSKIVTNWITSELFAILKKNDVNISESPISPINLGKLIKLIVTNKISGKMAKEIFVRINSSGTNLTHADFLLTLISV